MLMFRFIELLNRGDFLEASDLFAHRLSVFGYFAERSGVIIVGFEAGDAIIEFTERDIFVVFVGVHGGKYEGMIIGEIV